MRITKAEAIDIVETVDVVQSVPWKWGSRDAYVFHRDGSHWRFWIECHRSEGWQIPDYVSCEEVRSVTKTVTEWVKV